ncbi:hypothetical protein [Priestia sp. LL-8]|uniref:hypothetical protein n=1 Tax=Priestia sp. LL-8 TaxID=3110068 RepID=UPI002E271F63|nr:hypothetical protein [Priestia sp. LL-8]
MIDKLINEGKNLESEAKEGLGLKYFSSVEFEKWTTQSIFYLEQYFGNSAVTDKAKERFKTLNNNNNYSFYQFLLGSLEAAKEIKKDQEDNYTYSID